MSAKKNLVVFTAENFAAFCKDSGFITFLSYLNVNNS